MDNWELKGRERYFDTPQDQRDALLSSAYGRIGRCANGEPPAYYRGILAEREAEKNGRLRSCGRSMQLCDAHECFCGYPEDVRKRLRGTP